MNEEEEALNTHKVTPIEYEQSSPRGVLEITEKRSLSSRGSSFNENSPPLTEADTDEDDGGRVRWRNLVSKLKSKSLKAFLSRKKHNNNNNNKEEEDEVAVAVDDGVTKPSWRNFTFQELSAATDGFSHDNLVGRGGHAEVYKGCLPDGKLVAVKKITKREKKDEDRVEDFLSELGIIAHINHPNAARLIGFSSDTDLHLVLQFAPHGSLATLLHSTPNIFFIILHANRIRDVNELSLSLSKQSADK